MRRLMCALVCMMAVPAYGQDATPSRDAASLHANEALEWQKKADASAAEARKLDARLNALQTRQASKRQQGRSLRSQLARLTAREAEVLTRLERQRQQLDQLLTALMRLGARPAPALVANPANALDAARAARLMAAITPNLRMQAAALRRELEQLSTLRGTITGVRADLSTLDSQSRTLTADITALLAEKQRLSEIYHQRAERAAAAARAAAPGADDIEALLSGLKRPAVIHTPDLANLRGQLPLPASTRDVTRQANPTPHLLLALSPATPIAAPIGAEVAYVGALKGYGGVIILDIGDGHHIILSGVARVFVSVGDSVTVGTTLAESDAGAASMLRIEMRRRTHAIDPARWFNLKS